MSNQNNLLVDEFVRSIKVNKNSPHALFLGAGASLSSGVPSAGTCIQEWKREIFVTNNPTLNDLVAEPSVPSVRHRIDSWLKMNNHWPKDGEDDYSFFIERCHPIPEDRRKFFEPWIRNARPHVGYQLLCLLAQSLLVRSVWTTNFDTLVAKAAATTSLIPIEIGMDSQDRTIRQPSTTELLCTSLHGDYRYDLLKNTKDELQEQEATLKTAMVDTLKSQSLIVVGFSGRDASVMTALEEALCCKGPTKLYWCGYSDAPAAPVSDLIEKAKEHGRQAFYIPNSDFDDLMIRLATVCITEGPLANEVTKVIGSNDSSELPHRIKFGKVQSAPTGMVKSNAWPIRCPSEVFEFDLVEWPKERRWKWIESIVSDYQVVAVPFKKKVLAMGTIDDIKAAFGDKISGNIERVPTSETDLAYADGSVVSLLKRALIPSIAERLWLDTDNKFKAWEKSPSQTKSQNGRTYSIHRCMELDLRVIDGSTYLTVDPTFHIPSSSDDEKKPIDEIKKGLLGWQHNDKYSDELDHWRRQLSKDPETTSFEYPPSSGAFRFQLTNVSAYAAITRPGFRNFTIEDKFTNLIHHSGVVCNDPDLKFAKAASWNHGNDKMPLRGIAAYGPFDKELSALSPEVRISVVCPQAESAILEQFLDGIQRKWESAKQSKEDYLVPFRGFENEFRVPIRVPKRSDVTWITLPELNETSSPETGSRELARNINDAISAVAAIERSVVLILTPKRWEAYRHYEDETTVFDVHDFVKAYAAQRGISTQFITQEKLDVQDKCRFWWWFSVAAYAKSMRTPWVLDGLDDNTAYVGLGYSIDRKAERGNHIVLGCSHLYNSQGQGLEFRLNKIEDPIIKGRNAFLRFDDARRMGETIRSLYWDSKRKLPERVVIHKLFPFRHEEQKGLKAGLDGVKNLDLIEINHEPSLRYVSSAVRKGSMSVDRFPIRRGTTIRLSDFEALLWIHGATDAVKDNWTYFQGKRRIPGPVVLRRYGGSSQLSTIASEILGLSKMDWNSGDLYSQLPATVYSSKRIARIGRLLERFGSASFDYRLFM